MKKTKIHGVVMSCAPKDGVRHNRELTDEIKASCYLLDQSGMTSEMSITHLRMIEH